MKRRDFSGHLAALAAVAAGGAALAGSRQVLAQGGPVEGREFQRLAKEARTTLAAGKKVEVIEFFWYGCGHCFSFEPALEAWVAQLPGDVQFRRVPYPLLGPSEHQRLFYALEETGQLAALHRRIFNAIHVEQKRLNSEDEIAAFLKANGADPAKVLASFKSFGVINKLTSGRQLANDYRVESVPTLAVHGRYVTSPAMAGSAERALAVANLLIQRTRQAG